MATWYSTFYQNALGVTSAGAASSPLMTSSPPSMTHGRVRIAYFNFVNPASSPPAAGDAIQLCRVPAGARVVQTCLIWDAQTATATMSLGISGAVAKYMAAQTLTSAGVKFGPTITAELVDAVEAADRIVLGTFATAGGAANARIAGWVMYVLD